MGIVGFGIQWDISLCLAGSIMGRECSGIFPETWLGVRWAAIQWDISKHLAGGIMGLECSGIFPKTWLGVL